MTRLLNNYIIALDWSEARELIKDLQPELVKVIDTLSPSKQFRLYKVKYPYGVLFPKSTFSYPNNQNQHVTLDHASLPVQLKKDMDYVGNRIPVGIVLKKSIEIFLDNGKNTFPFKLYNPGNIFGLWRCLDSKDSFHAVNFLSLTIGVRSTFLLPNVTDSTHHTNFKRDYGLKLPPPRRLLDQWHIFKSLSNVPQGNNWEAELLLFSRAWIDAFESDKRWQTLKKYMLEIAWNASAYVRNQFLHNFIFSIVREKRNLKPNPYIADTAKHLMTLAAGGALGFAPVTDERHLPLDLIQNAYLHSYGLKNYIPTIFVPAKFEFNDPQSPPIYYSLQLPTTYEFSPRSRKDSSIIYDLCELKHITSTFQDEVCHSDSSTGRTIMKDIFNNTRFEYFHNHPDKYDEVLHSRLMPEEDPRLLFCTKSDKCKFADSGTFVKGCVRLKYINL